MYDPFARGPEPVGVTSLTLDDPKRGGRSLNLEIWYPAHERYRGQDLTPASQDEFPIFGGYSVRQEAVRDAEPALAAGARVVLFSHGFAGHRRQSTFFCAHVASHGYLVLAPDHAGNTLSDMVMLALSLGPQQMPPDPEQLLGSFVFDRPRDLSLSLDALASGPLAARFGALDVSAVGMTGHSFGGWTALVLASRDPRVRAVLPLAPAGGPGPLWMLSLERELSWDFAPDVETLYLCAQRDTLLPEVGIQQMFLRTPDPARMLVLENADHMHFCDRVERSHEFFRNMPQVGPFGPLAKRLPPMSELAPGSHGHRFANGLGVLHLDAVLRGRAEARAFFAGDVVDALRTRGIAIREVTRAHRI